jgi:ketosteroid isomerase-like protein
MHRPSTCLTAASMAQPLSAERRTGLGVMAAIAALVLVGCATPAPDLTALGEQVRASETAFAASMQARDFQAFSTWVADDAVFINAGKPLRGKAAVLAHWQRFFAGPQAPFSWKPELVQVIDSGGLAYSEGPVSLPTGEVVARYASTWRRDPAGAWRIVLDHGYDVCNCGKR